MQRLPADRFQYGTQPEEYNSFTWLVTLNLFFIPFLLSFGIPPALGTIFKHFPTKARSVFLLSQVISAVYF